MKKFIEKCLQRSWSGHGMLSFLMLPVALLYALGVQMRRLLYESGKLKTHRLKAMVIVVGNVVAGGAGKTPTVISLVRHLTQQGYSVGVISRGYGRKRTDVRAVDATSSAGEVGDEPLLISRRTGVPVWVGGTRAQAGHALLKNHPEVQILICDDGLQHYGLWRDLEVCVFDNRGPGNGRLLPAGPLREPWPRKLVSAVGQAPEKTLVLNTGSHPCVAGFTAQRHLEAFAVNSAGEEIALNQLQSGNTLPLLALAGIAQPQGFFHMLKTAGLHLQRTLAMPDHYDFLDMDPSTFIGYQVVCTEKDAVKLWHIAPKAWAVPLTQVLDAPMLSTLDERVRNHFDQKLSSPHGHPFT